MLLHINERPLAAAEDPLNMLFAVGSFALMKVRTDLSGFDPNLHRILRLVGVKIGSDPFIRVVQWLWIPEMESHLSAILRHLPKGNDDGLLIDVPQLMDQHVEKPPLRRHYKMRPPRVDLVEEFDAVVDEDKIADVVKAVKLEALAQRTRRFARAKSSKSRLDEPFLPVEKSVDYMESSKISKTSRPPSVELCRVPVKQRKSGGSEVSDQLLQLHMSSSGRSTCRYCNCSLRAIDKHGDDGRYALECRSRECLRFNGFTNDKTLIERLKRRKIKEPLMWLVRVTVDSEEYHCYLPNVAPQNCWPRKPPAGDQPIMVRCPGQKRLCMLL
ncbi:unnamed protein product [Toxocara canis]|uniref:PARP-type domain-containing protein n=1 Tax=Toxocara canis TaxID=6265 RepID=A0A183V982_TOXCA|nr:unnamed protein product [Toxocara canis]